MPDAQAIPKDFLKPPPLEHHADDGHHHHVQILRAATTQAQLSNIGSGNKLPTRRFEFAASAPCEPRELTP
jgi:hypothetical protein